MSLYYYTSSPETFIGPLQAGQPHPTIPNRTIQGPDPANGIYNAVLASNVQCAITATPTPDLPEDDVSQYHDRVVSQTFEGVEGQASGLVREVVSCVVFDLTRVRDTKLEELVQECANVSDGGTVSGGNDVQTSVAFLAQATGDFSSSQGTVPNNQDLTYIDIRGAFYTRVKNVLDVLIGDISNHRRLSAENHQVHDTAVRAETDAQTLAEYDITVGWPANPVP